MGKRIVLSLYVRRGKEGGGRLSGMRNKRVVFLLRLN